MVLAAWTIFSVSMLAATAHDHLTAAGPSSGYILGISPLCFYVSFMSSFAIGWRCILRCPSGVAAQRIFVVGVAGRTFFDSSPAFTAGQS